MKYEWRKQERDLYLPKGIQVVNVPQVHFLTLTGHGDPNQPAFSAQIQALYPVAYAVRMALKKGEFGTPYEYTVYPLEGVWTTTDGSRDATLNKAALAYTIMLRQPDQVTAEQVQLAIARTRDKHPSPYLDQLQFVTYTEGRCLQATHTGSFDTEGTTFAAMRDYLTAHQLTTQTTMGDYQHREIYLSDFRRVAPERRKTTLQWRLA
ncbi:hypothetical protein LZY01_20390 [Levilactobacillus zymae]|uniref:GyrI-like small molecule binding domain-containing protein n=1 Tax=Levilactobacillus zymae TaxID=267363 RepID=A0ABQ0WYR2_9LACO|nr:GyrI-like domain-containing protein [Levilactobacillus zymae]KRL16420.1 hypothetical protein FD38_GL002278 [Levilactobacillus zymae DSM 19395]QFR61804.1 hypothetical protein LZ395_09810 [Levilactobacillus zymae]GEO72871.1 hypothetical protein LZY01_20390 [Levilactobacillus zymae]